MCLCSLTNAENVSNIFTFMAISLPNFGFPILPLNQNNQVFESAENNLGSVQLTDKFMLTASSHALNVSGQWGEKAIGGN